MPIPTPPPAPNPLEPDFAPKAYAFTVWMHDAAPEFDAAADRANEAKDAAEQAATDAASARDAAVDARGQAQGFATAAGEASGLASDAQAGAESARDAAAATYQGFDKRFLGDKATPPTTDNQGGALLVGAQYYNTVLQSMRIWSGTAWDAAYLPAAAYQEKLFSGTNIKTVNGQDLIGAGNVVAVADIVRSAKTAAYTAVAADKGRLLDCSGTWTLGFAAAATLGNGWWCYVRNTGAGTITADPAGSELIDGVATAAIPAGTTLLLTCDGAALNSAEIKRRTYDRRQLFTSTGTFVVPAGVYVVRGYAVGAGSAASAVAGGSGGGMAYGDIAVKPGDVVSLSIVAGVAKLIFGGVDLLIGNPAASASAGGTATKHASVESGGAYPGGSSTSGYFGGASSGSPLGPGREGGFGGSGWGGTGGLVYPIGPNGGGGVGAAAQGIYGGRGLPQMTQIVEPILQGLNGPTTSTGAAGALGSGGGGNGSGKGGDGGFGGGGGSGSTGGGVGGFGGGGGAGQDSGAPGGAGGVGGGGGSGGRGGAPGAGGPAAVLLIY